MTNQQKDTLFLLAYNEYNGTSELKEEYANKKVQEAILNENQFFKTPTITVGNLRASQEALAARLERIANGTASKSDMELYSPTAIAKRLANWDAAKKEAEYLKFKTSQDTYYSQDNNAAEFMVNNLKYFTPVMGTVLLSKDATHNFSAAKDAYNLGYYLPAAGYALKGISDELNAFASIFPGYLQISLGSRALYATSPRLLKMTNTAVNEFLNAARLTRFSGLVGLLRAAATHPTATGRLFKYALDPINPRIKTAVNTLTDNLSSYTGINSKPQVNKYGLHLYEGSYGGKKVSPHITRDQGIVAPIDSFYDRIPDTHGFYSAIMEGRYAPFLTYPEKKAYLKAIEDTYNKSLLYVKDFNKNLILFTTEKGIMPWYQRDLDDYNRYKLATEKEIRKALEHKLLLNELELKGILQNSEEGRKFLKSKNPFINLDLSNLDLSKRIDYLTDAIKKAKPKFEDYYLFDTPPEFIMRTRQNPTSPNSMGVYAGNKITLQINDNHLPNTFRALNNKNLDGIPWITAHEADHWILSNLPKSKSIVRYDPVSEYYTFNNKIDQPDFPFLKNLDPYRWETSPMEWRSETVGFARANNLPSDFTKWTPEQVAQHNEFMKRRFPKVQLYLVDHNTARSIGDLAREMISKGYKHGGKLKQL